MQADAQWAELEPHYFCKPSDPGCSDSNNRRIVEVCCGLFERLLRRAPLGMCLAAYKWRHLIEDFFGGLDVFKRISLCRESMC